MDTTTSKTMVSRYIGLLPKSLANGFIKKTQSPRVKMTHAVAFESVLTDTPNSFDIGTNPGPSMGP